MKRNRRIVKFSQTSPQALVVHEGVSNYPVLSDGIKLAIDKLQSLQKSNAHLADIGCGISFLNKELEHLSKRCFEIHKEEKEMSGDCNVCGSYDHVEDFHNPTVKQKVEALMKANPKLKESDAYLLLGKEKTDDSFFDELLKGVPDSLKDFLR